jgi:polyphosphate kinase
VTRNSDLAIEEEESENLMQDLERELRQRTFRRAVRLEVEADMPPELSRVLARGLEVLGRETYHVDGILDPSSLMRPYKLERFKHLKDPPFNPRLSARLGAQGSIFSILRERDLLLHHPFEAFSTVVELLRDAAHDPKVLAIKLTLYRTSGDSAIIDALKEAAQNGKQVTAVVELKARFDERNNIVWARELERAGCHVVYGIVGLKTHCKAALIVRRENNRVVRYVHLSTGNYNSTTARLYTDIALLTHDAEIGEDVSLLFNVLTGYNSQNVKDAVDGRKVAPTMRKLAVSPFNMREKIVQLIDDEIRLHSAQRPGLIQAKFNSLVDPTVVEALYRASVAGVTIRLQVRGICCLRPGIPGVSENITVTSVVDRFLEHARLFHFRHGGADLVFLSSADWMPRNLYRRVEVLFPVEDPLNKARCIDEILAISLGDNVKARRLLPDGRYVRVEPGDKPLLRSQTRLMEITRVAGIKQAPEVDEVRVPEESGKRGSRGKRSRRTEAR